MIDILFQNDSLLVIDKPAGLASQPGEGVSGSVVSVLEEQLGYKVYPIHRLDKDTAGCMMLAKSSAAASQWSGILSERLTHKRYLAVCIGLPPGEEGIYRDALKSGERTQDAETAYRRIAAFGQASGQGDDRGASGDGSGGLKSRKPAGNPLVFSLLEFRLGTGRTHQIRRHCAMHGHPIVGDDRYGDFALNRKLKKEAHAKRLLLWAWGLELPGLGLVISTLPPHLKDFLNQWESAPKPDSLLPTLREVP
jgi:23S rRNA pseudouridine955/2504/2580 synthase